jgi:DNA (cytosine-5)-methyltransferase 1
MAARFVLYTLENGNWTVRHGDAFAGIGGFGLAARRLGWETVWAAEIEPSARSVYAARLGRAGLRFDRDIRESRELPAIDVLTGGFPCQDLSVAGKRAGLAGSRSGLFFELARILDESRPTWFVFENVPGLLSSNSGRDMGVVLSTLAELGYGVAWRILNAQFFGVAQRRRRVFIVGHSSGDERRAAAVLFERAGLRGDSSEIGEEGRDVAYCVTRRTREGGDPTSDQYVTVGTLQKPNGGWRVDAEGARDGQLVVTHSLRAEGFDASEDGTGRGTPLVSLSLKSGGNDRHDATHQTYIAPTLRCGGMADSKRPAGSSYDNTPLVADPISAVEGKRYTSEGNCFRLVNAFDVETFRKSHRATSSEDAEHWNAAAVADTVTAFDQTDVRATTLALDGSTPNTAGMRDVAGIPAALDVCPICEVGPDTPRYRGLGNAVAVPVVEWILRRIDEAER